MTDSQPLDLCAIAERWRKCSTYDDQYDFVMKLSGFEAQYVYETSAFLVELSRELASRLRDIDEAEDNMLLRLDILALACDLQKRLGPKVGITLTQPAETERRRTGKRRA
ncbi:MAG: hypothetical protein ACYC1C_15515 [Chloroflexota bacterium]